jgi:ankyrin repeat protein
MNDIEYTAINRIFGKAMAMTKRDDDGKYATIIRKHAKLMMEELGNDFDVEMAQEQRQLYEERQAEANRQLFKLVKKKGQPNWNLQSFMETVTNLIQQQNADINTKDKYGNTLLSYFCFTAKLTDQDQSDAITFLLAQGADPNQGRVLDWVIRRYCDHKIVESEFVEILHRMIEDYHLDVNSKEGNSPWIGKVIHFLMYECNDVFSGIINLRFWSVYFFVIITNFLKHHGDINLQDSNDGSTILSLVLYAIQYMSESAEELLYVNNIVSFFKKMWCGY